MLIHSPNCTNNVLSGLENNQNIIKALTPTGFSCPLNIHVGKKRNKQISLCLSLES